MSDKKNIFERIAEGQIWKSIFRGGGVPSTRRQRMMVVLNSCPVTVDLLFLFLLIGFIHLWI